MGFEPSVAYTNCVSVPQSLEPIPVLRVGFDKILSKARPERVSSRPIADLFCRGSSLAR